MALNTMYAAQANSPATTLTVAIGAADTTILVTSAAVLPSTVPYELSLGIGEAAAETVLVTAVSGNSLTVTRGWDGTPQAWPVNTVVARTFSARDLNDLQANVQALNTGLSGLVTTDLTQTGKAADAATVGEMFEKTLYSVGTLTSTDDLDNVTQPGFYFMGRNYSGAGGFPANAPSGFSGNRGRVLVIRTTTSVAGAWQIAVDGASVMWVRGYSGTAQSGSWTDWKKQASISDVPVLDTGLDTTGEAADAGAVGEMFEKTLYSVGTLTSSDDLNNVTQPGFYFYGTYAGGGGAPANAPPATGSRIRVLVIRTTSSQAGAWQMVVDNAGVLWVRGFSGMASTGSWTEWQSSINRAEVQTYGVKPITIDIPYTAVDYHALWTPLVTAGLCSRGAAYYPIDGDSSKWPIYTYTINAGKNWMGPGGYGVNTGVLYKRPRALVISGVHGSERATPVFLLEFVKRLTQDPAYAALLAAYDWTFVPLVNPWGFSHSYVNGSGTIYRGTDFAPSGYTLYENSADNGYNGGVRRTPSADYSATSSTPPTTGLDPNRDWSDVEYVNSDDGLTYGFKTHEATYLRNLFIDGSTRKFDLLLDLHQARTALSTYADKRCGFVFAIPSRSAGEMAVWRSIIARAAAETDVALCKAYGLAYKQYGYPWNYQAGPTFSNYAAGQTFDYDGEPAGNTLHTDRLVQYAQTLETCSVCNPFAGTNDPYSKGSTDYGNTFVDNFIRKMFSWDKITGGYVETLNAEASA